MIGNSNDDTNSPHKLVVTATQVLRPRKDFANGSPCNTKLLKTQLSTMVQLGRLSPLIFQAIRAGKAIVKGKSSKLVNPNLGQGINLTPPPCCFSLINSETVKAATLAFCGMQQHLIIDILAKFGIANLPKSPDIW